MEKPRCRSCGADILWLQMESGKMMPVDAKPEKRVVVVDTPNADGEVLLREDGPRGRLVNTYVSHFATCVHAAEHRRNP